MDGALSNCSGRPWKSMVALHPSLRKWCRGKEAGPKDGNCLGVPRILERLLRNSVGAGLHVHFRSIRYLRRSDCRQRRPQSHHRRLQHLLEPLHPPLRNREKLLGLLLHESPPRFLPSIHESGGLLNDCGLLSAGHEDEGQLSIQLGYLSWRCHGLPESSHHRK